MPLAQEPSARAAAETGAARPPQSLAQGPDPAPGAAAPPPGTATPSPGPAAPGKLVFGLAFAQFGLYLAVFTPVTVTLALRVAQILPESERGAGLGRVLSVGAVLAMIGNPVFGALSDRTAGRFGRRRPWLVGGAVGGFAGLLVVAFADSVGMLTFGWALAQLGVNAALSALTSCVPDLVPEHQRGRVSGVIGMMLSVAMVTGSYLAQAFSGSLATAFVVPGLIGIASVLYLCAVLKQDRPAAPGTFAPYSLKEFFGSFWVNPRKHPDFGWNFASRFLVFCAISCVTSYQVYFLMDRLGYSADEVAGKMATGTLIMVLATVVGSVVGGVLSDRAGRRKPFVLASAAVIGVGLMLVSSAHSFGMFLVALVIFGFGEGLYLAVDLALAAKVLPDPETTAKDMGVLNIANAFPQSLVPILAPALLAIGGGGNYGALFLFGGVCAVVGALLVQLIRTVK